MKGENIERSPYVIPVAVFALGALSTLLLLWLLRIHYAQRETNHQITALMDIQIKTATFHLWFEEAITKGSDEGMRQSMVDLDTATRLSLALLQGGTSDQGEPLRPLVPPDYRKRAEKIAFLLTDLRNLALQRERDPKGAGIGSPQDDRFNAAFRECQEAGRTLESLVEKDAAEDHERTKRLLFAVFVVWSGIIAGSTWVFYVRETRHRRDAEALLRSEDDLARAQAVAHVGNWRLDVRTNDLWWSDETYRIFGIPGGETLSYESFLASVHPDDRENVDRAWKAALRGEPYDIEHRIVRGDEVKWIRERAEVEFNRLGNPVGGFGTAQDITKRRLTELVLEKAYEEMDQRVVKRTSDLVEANRRLQEEIAERTRAERSLAESERSYRNLALQFRTLLDAIPDTITLVSPDLEILWANRGAGARADAAVSGAGTVYCYELWHKRDAPCTSCPVLASSATGTPQTARIVTPEGRHWEVRAVPILDGSGRIESVLEVAKDITDTIALQAQTMRTAHLASIGQLAAGVAHEINNPINGVLNYAQILHNRSPEGSVERRITSRILKEGERISGIVRGLLSFARARKAEKRIVPAAQILSDALALTRAQMNKDGIDLRIAMPRELPDLFVQPQEIQQVFMNLLGNARYALNQKYPRADADKILEIRGERVAGPESPRVRIVFRDRGVGFPAGTQDRAMEPFFTTKPSGEGTGLGLSISHRIITDNGGTISIGSVEGEFTEVVVDLPTGENGNGENPGSR